MALPLGEFPTMMEMSRLLKKHGMRVSRVHSSLYPSGYAFALFNKCAGDNPSIEWRREFQYRRQAYAKANELIAGTCL
jgi:hypothetical protein